MNTDVEQIQLLLKNMQCAVEQYKTAIENVLERIETKEKLKK